MWLVVVVAFLLALPSLWTIQAYGAVTAIASIGLAPAYVIPGFLRARQGKNFKEGAWNLGKWGPLVGYTASVWVVIEVVLFCLPQASPVTALTFNYAPIALVGGAAAVRGLVAGPRARQLRAAGRRGRAGAVRGPGRDLSPAGLPE